MSRFNSVDTKLGKLSKQLNGRLTSDRHERMPMPKGYEERRIDWVRDGINCVIQIYPTVKDWKSKLNK
ncbi:MAG: hypothetical protein AAF620_12600 [Bacteroidota bacterium]